MPRKTQNKKRDQRAARAVSANEVRIIGGDWRRRVLRFPPGTSARPTPDRVRETLFNWLSHHVIGARCLDLFAGTGALGMEALSRGAAHVTFVDRDSGLLRAIGQSTQLFGGAERARAAQTVQADAYTYVPQAPVDLVFIDPPYDDQALDALLERLTPHLQPDARLYVEHAANKAPAWLCGHAEPPPGWVIARSGRAGVVRYHLIQFERAPDAATHDPGSALRVSPEQGDSA